MTRGRHIFSSLKASVCALALAGCMSTPESGNPYVAPPSAPPIIVEQTTTPTRMSATAESAALTAFYQRTWRTLRANGLLRTVREPTDAHYDAQKLADNFVRIALNNEYVAVGTRVVARQTPTPLRRWEEPVRFQLSFGPSVSEEIQTADTAAFAQVVGELANATGHAISIAPAANFHVLVLNENELRASGDMLRTRAPRIDERTINYIENMGRAQYCAVVTTSAGGTSGLSAGVAVIRAEQPPEMRQACLHEELAQGLGLVNDSPKARPSIFNDDNEFALLTDHDLALLRILYDRRLASGMTPETAAPIAATLAREVLGETR